MADLRATVDALVDRGRIPDMVLRGAIKTLVLGRLVASRVTRGLDVEALWDGPVTIAVDDANRQHYTVPDTFFATILGPHLKYSCAVWPQTAQTLTDAEEAALSLTCERADLKDGQAILELGCGWGSLTLWMASAYPAATITAVSNSPTQRDYIMNQAAQRGLSNVNVVTRDIGTLTSGTDSDVVAEGKFDRIVSVEMMEHARNHRELGRRIAGWLKSDGSLFVHVFAHKTRPYLFDVGTTGDWMARHFFTGGMMPSVELLPHAFDQLTHQQTWWVNGRHYSKTLAAWRRRLDANRDQLVALLQDDGPRELGETRLNRWRVFLIACEELFAFGGGRQWGVVHQRFSHPKT
ncbi:MAG: cyclopropane-fatty-acyl-phospholipid synthase family protein [Nitriliruptoraceae bacterium]